MGRDVYPFPSPSTISSTPSWASTLAMELQPYSSTGGTPFPTPKEVEAVKRQVLQTTPPSRMGAQQEATTPGIEGVQPLAATPLSGSGDRKRKAEEEGQEETKREKKMKTIEEEEEGDVKLVPLHKPEEEEEYDVKLVPVPDVEEILKYV